MAQVRLHKGDLCKILTKPNLSPCGKPATGRRTYRWLDRAGQQVVDYWPACEEHKGEAKGVE
jgi:hypothetical protein